MEKREIYRFGDAYGWIEDGTSIQFKAATAEGDPLDINSAEARKIAELLIRLADEMDKLDSYVYE